MRCSRQDRGAAVSVVLMEVAPGSITRTRLRHSDQDKGVRVSSGSRTVRHVYPNVNIRDQIAYAHDAYRRVHIRHFSDGCGYKNLAIEVHLGNTLWRSSCKAAPTQDARTAAEESN